MYLTEIIFTNQGNTFGKIYYLIKKKLYKYSTLVNKITMQSNRLFNLTIKCSEQTTGVINK